MFNTPPSPSTPPAPQESIEVNPLRKLWWGLGILGAGLVSLYLFYPRGGGPAAPSTTTAGAEWNSARCDRLLTDAYRSLSPERFGVTSSEDATLRDLNQWVDKCGAKSKDEAWNWNDVEKLLPADSRAAIDSGRFLRRDAFHIRMCRLGREIVLRLVPKNLSDAERAEILFNYVMRQVELRPTVGDAPPPPFTPFDCLVYGEGTAAERAWVFVELLRQVPIDAVVFLSDEAGGEKHPLVGVLTPDRGCLLYDCTLGLSIPASLKDDPAILFSKPANWKEAVASDELFRQLDVGMQPHPWTAERLKGATINLVGTASWWSRRMANLQFQLQPIAGNGLTLSAPLVDVAKDQPGYLARVRSFSDSAFDREKIRIWGLPDEHIHAAESGTPSPYAVVLQRVFNGPMTRQTKVVNGQQQTVEAFSSRPLKLIRVWQLLGNEETLRGYLAIRNAPSEIGSDDNKLSAQFATFWVGLSQLEQEGYSAARETLAGYLNMKLAAPQQPVRGGPALRLVAESLAEEKKPEAIELLGRIKSPTNAHRYAILTEHWKRLFGMKPAAGEAKE